MSNDRNFVDKIVQGGIQGGLDNIPVKTIQAELAQIISTVTKTDETVKNVNQTVDNVDNTAGVVKWVSIITGSILSLCAIIATIVYITYTTRRWISPSQE